MKRTKTPLLNSGMGMTDWEVRSFDAVVENFIYNIEAQYSDNHIVDEVFVDRITVVRSQ